MKRVLLSVFGLIVLFTVSGCVSNIDEDKLIGTWIGKDNNMIFVFDKNGFCKSGIYDKDKNYAYASSCTYQINDNHIVLISGDEKEEYMVYIKNDDLKLKTESGNVITFKLNKDKVNGI